MEINAKKVPSPTRNDLTPTTFDPSRLRSASRDPGGEGNEHEESDRARLGGVAGRRGLRPGFGGPAEAMSKVKAAGYSSVFSIEPDDGHWEGKGIKNGRVHEFHVDPRTGAITKDQPDS